MKLLKTFLLSLVVLAVSFLNLTCTRDTPQIAVLDTNFGNSATVQVFCATLKAARNYIYVDNVPVSGIVLGYQGVFPGTAYAFKVTAGSHSFMIKDTAAATTQTPITFSQSVDAGKSYTIFTYDTITSVKQSTVLNKIVIPKDTTCMLRFANFIYSTSPVANVDVYSYRRGAATPVFSNVATAQVTDFIPYASGLTDTLYVYATGTTSPLLVKSFITSLTPTRSYTATYNGIYTGTKTVTTFATY
jgi:hypothetical protein